MGAHLVVRLVAYWHRGEVRTEACLEGEIQASPAEEDPCLEVGKAVHLVVAYQEGPYQEETAGGLHRRAVVGKHQEGPRRAAEELNVVGQIRSHQAADLHPTHTQP